MRGPGSCHVLNRFLYQYHVSVSNSAKKYTEIKNAVKSTENRCVDAVLKKVLKKENPPWEVFKVTVRTWGKMPQASPQPQGGAPPLCSIPEGIALCKKESPVRQSHEPDVPQGAHHPACHERGICLLRLGDRPQAPGLEGKGRRGRLVLRNQNIWQVQ